MIDPFIIYNEAVQYSPLRETMSAALFGKQVGKLVEATQVRNMRFFMYTDVSDPISCFGRSLM